MTTESYLPIGADESTVGYEKVLELSRLVEKAGFTVTSFKADEVYTKKLFEFEMSYPTDTPDVATVGLILRPLVDIVSNYTVIQSKGDKWVVYCAEDVYPQDEEDEDELSYKMDMRHMSEKEPFQLSTEELVEYIEKLYKC